MSLKLLRVNDAADELGISGSWLRRAEKRGKFPLAKRDLNGWRIYTEADMAFLRGKPFPATKMSREFDDLSDHSMK